MFLTEKHQAILPCIFKTKGGGTKWCKKDDDDDNGGVSYHNYDDDDDDDSGVNKSDCYDDCNDSVDNHSGDGDVMTVVMGWIMMELITIMMI